MAETTTTVRTGDEGMPSVRALAIAAGSMGLGVVVKGDFEEVALPYPKVLVDAIVGLARTWDEAFGKVTEIFGKDPSENPVVDEGTDDDFPINYTVHACHGAVHVEFDDYVDEMILDPEEAMKFAEGIRAAAARAIAEGEVDGAEGAGGSGACEA
jgi:hypothetical protein